MTTYSTPDLTKHPPRSPRVRLGGFVHLPRLLDKARAFAAGKNGEYNYNCPLDRTFFEFTGVDPEALLAEVRAGKSDSEILAWVNDHSTPRREPWEIQAWSLWFSERSPGAAAGHAWFGESINKLASGREDIRTFFDLLDLDDYISFGGRG